MSQDNPKLFISYSWSSSEHEQWVHDLATQLVEAGIDVIRPEATTADKQEDAAILIAISANDEIWIDRRETDPRALRTAIERLHSENPKGSIVIQADEASTNEMLVIVLEAAKQVGVANVAIATDAN